MDVDFYKSKMGSLDRVCRVCLNGEAESICIFQGEDNGDELIERMLTCLAITISREDKLSKIICCSCLVTLNNFYEFRTLAIKSQTWLTQQNVELGTPIEDTSISIETVRNGAGSHEFGEEPIMNVFQSDSDQEIFSPSKDDDKSMGDHLSDPDDDLEYVDKVEERTKKQKSLLAKCACENCGKEHRLARDVRRCERIQNSQKKFSCDSCEYETSRTSHLRSHLLSHTNIEDSPYKCTTCNQRFRKQSDAVDHENFHLDVRQYECALCNTKFHFKRQLHIHINKAHPSDKATLNAKPGSSSQLDQQRKSKSQKTLLCQHCGKECNSSELLRKHVKIHSNDRPFECQVCNKKFKRKWDLQVHMRIHSGEKSFKCSQCDKFFTQRSTLTAHMNTHIGTRLHTCQSCRKKFTRKHDMTRHVKSCCAVGNASNVS